MEDRRILELHCQKDLSTGCWLWTKARDAKGYGRVRRGRNILYVHRLAAAIWLGVPLDSPDRRVLHTCGVKHCFNPDHLRVEEVEEKYLYLKRGK